MFKWNLLVLRSTNQKRDLLGRLFSINVDSNTYIFRHLNYRQSLPQIRCISTSSNKSYRHSKISHIGIKSIIGTGLIFSGYLLIQKSSLPITYSQSSSLMDELASADDRISVQDKKVSELVRSLLVYKLCSFQSLVNFAPNLLELAKRLHLSWFAYWTIKKTFFAQFCG